jgi:hypothetical protein
VQCNTLLPQAERADALTPLVCNSKPHELPLALTPPSVNTSSTNSPTLLVPVVATARSQNVCSAGVAGHRGRNLMRMWQPGGKIEGAKIIDAGVTHDRPHHTARQQLSQIKGFL